MAEQASQRFGVYAVNAEQLESKVLQQVWMLLPAICRACRRSCAREEMCPLCWLSSYAYLPQAQANGTAAEDVSEGRKIHQRIDPRSRYTRFP